MKNIYSIIAVFAIAFASAFASAFALSPVAAFAGGDAVTKTAAEAKTAADNTPMTDGEVKKVDKDGGKVTIKHGDIKNLDMPGMTMVFRVKDATMLDQLKVGDKIKFAADNVNGKLTVTKVEIVK